MPVREVKPKSPTRCEQIEAMMLDMGCKGEYISSRGIISRIESVDYETIVLAGQQMMFCGIRLRGGFVAVSKPSLALDPENFREEIGKKVSFEDAFQSIYELEAYRMLAAKSE
ncbi:Gp49 family protein [Alteromonas sp. RKMC-009]|uniref:Gp49 family protein n=1 Tax=Alteromonas sp. RKMC-009 TaxID=2267264 RepID=UPI000E687A47|nr:Gp49 family protein [Alteromonas sp. RKMC-009]AYA64286.1 hypothetical protein DS731_09925 [Alteromonas sp. RKMC-009]